MNATATPFPAAPAAPPSPLPAPGPAPESLSSRIDELRHKAVPALEQAAEQAGALAQRGVDGLREGSRQWLDRARQVRRDGVHYVQDEPVKAVLIAAATGAALMALITLVSRSRRDS